MNYLHKSVDHKTLCLSFFTRLLLGIPQGTLRDSIFVLEGLLEQQTGLNPVEIMTDTADTSEIIFGLFWLLGYQFSPRLADAGEAVFWRGGVQICRKRRISG
ncbi:TnpA family transposase [Yokenella regensburgei]|nr:TnpA family transposase [Yokenella regensburgei]